MMRYIRLYGYFLRFSFSKAMEFRFDFFFRIVMDLIYYAVNIGFYGVLFHHIDSLGGWSLDETLVFVGGFLVIDALSMTLFANNLWNIHMFVNNGDLDYYLIRPVSSLFFLSLRDFATNSFVNLIAAGTFLTWGLLRYPHDLSLIRIVGFVLLIILGALLRYLLRMCFVIPTFWLHSGQGLELVFFHLNRFIERPDRIFTGFVRIILTSILPFSLMASYPARVLLDPFSLEFLLHFFIVFLAFGLFVRWFWREGLKNYSSASS